MTLGARVRETREARGWSQAELARRVSALLGRKLTQVAIHHVEARGNVMPRFVVELARALTIDLDWLRTGKGNSDPGTPYVDRLQSDQKVPQDEVRPVDASVSIPSRSEMPKDLPVLGVAHGSEIGDFTIMNGETIDHVRRPPKLKGRADVFALFVQNGSMEPRFHAGELIIVESNRPPRNGDDVIIALNPEKEGDGDPALLKRLVATTPTKYKLEQHTPKRTIEIERKKVRRIYRVMTLADLFEA